MADVRKVVRWRWWGLKRSSRKCEVFLAASPLILVSLKYLLSIPVMRFLVPFRWIKNWVNVISLQISISHRQWHLTRKKLENLCRICGEKLQKSKGAVTSKFRCLKWEEFLAQKFSIFVENDLEEIHPQFFATRAKRIPSEDLLFQLGDILIFN